MIPVRRSLWVAVVAILVLQAPPGSTAQQAEGAVGRQSAEILTLERSALGRWITFDPRGYLEIYAPEVTYFDPSQDLRVAGLPAMQKLFAAVRRPAGDLYTRRFEMIQPKVQFHGPIAVLTYNLVTYGKTREAPEVVLRRWNCTEVYGRLDGDWKIIHSHWSFTRPDQKKPEI